MMINEKTPDLYALRWLGLGRWAFLRSIQMIILFRCLVVLFFLSSALFIFFSDQRTFAKSGDTESQKVIAEYGLWTVVINFLDVSNPRCQVKGVAATADTGYSGPVTFWKEQHKGNLTPVAEVGLFRGAGPDNRIPLKKEPGVHTFMIRKMSVRGVRRETDPHMAIFNVGNSMVKEMTQTDVAIATLIDFKGGEHDLLIPLDGFKEAWSLCDP